MKVIEVLVICDDRGRDLKEFMLSIQSEMDEPRLVNYSFVIHDKATIYAASTSPLNELSAGKFDIIVIFLGTNDLITRHLNGHISPKYYDIGNLVDTLTDKLQAAKAYLTYYCKYVIVSHVLGLDFDRFNHYQSDYVVQQLVLDEALPFLNQAIVSINADDDISTPMIQDTLHTRTKGIRFHKYHKLFDGLNPRSSITISWAEQMHKCVAKNIEFLFPF